MFLSNWYKGLLLFEALRCCVGTTMSKTAARLWINGTRHFTFEYLNLRFLFQIRLRNRREQCFGIRKLRDLYELRLMLEPQMAYYAALRATDEELAQILALGRQVDNHSYTKNEDLEGNQLFHNAIVQATHNEFSVKLMELLHKALIQSFRENKVQQTMSEDSLLDHQLIMRFLQNRDADGAKLAMELHMKHALRDYKI